MKKSFEPGDLVFTFLGENLCSGRVTTRYDELRIAVVDDDNHYCVFEEFCYPSKKEAVIAMQQNLTEFFSEELNK